MHFVSNFLYSLFYNKVSGCKKKKKSLIEPCCLIFTELELPSEKPLIN